MNKGTSNLEIDWNDQINSSFIINPEDLDELENDIKIENKDRKYIYIKIIMFCIYIFIFIIFMSNVYNYAKNDTYEDEDVVIKEMPLGYNVYNKNWDLKEVNFFNWEIKWNKNLITYVNNQILFSDSKIEVWKWDVTILKDPTNIYNKTTKSIISDIYIKKILKLDLKNYIILYMEKRPWWVYNYCIKKNNLNFSSNNKKECILSSSQKIDFSFTQFEDYYVIWLDKNIYIYKPQSKTILLEIETKWQILWLSRNEYNDIKIISKNWVKTLSHIYLKYYLIKRIKMQTDKIKLPLNKFL